ncbi:LysM peptidoglycan-binding domain-containing protein [Marinicrinis sediminis]|uniref:LysM peptidoglycan-binding domain-containing protein n=1 Tax=Marinicrinis sediminis TaxID=1652465 RepID=A0ABW5RDF5_9BACL
MHYDQFLASPVSTTKSAPTPSAPTPSASTHPSVSSKSGKPPFLDAQHTRSLLYTYSNSIGSETGLDQKTRLHKRRMMRFVLLTAIAILLVSFLYGAIARAGHSTDESGQEAVYTIEETKQQVVIQPGDTLWELAQLHAPKGTSLQAYVYELKQVNNLKNQLLQPGDVLLLP